VFDIDRARAAVDVDRFVRDMLRKGLVTRRVER
jgi:hypothetical protein